MRPRQGLVEVCHEETGQTGVVTRRSLARHVEKGWRPVSPDEVVEPDDTQGSAAEADEAIESTPFEEE